MLRLLTRKPRKFWLLIPTSRASREALPLTLPVSVARAVLLALMPLEIVTRKRLPFNSQQLRTLSRHWSFDDAKARSAFDWSPRGLDEGLPPTVEFLKGTIREKT